MNPREGHSAGEDSLGVIHGLPTVWGHSMLLGTQRWGFSLCITGYVQPTIWDRTESHRPQLWYYPSVS